MNRVAVIGLDAAEPLLIDQMMAEGQLPTLQRLMHSGASCRLRSESTWRSGRVWETLLTGQADFPSAAIFDPATYSSYQLGSRRRAPFYANIPDVNLLALDVPYMSLWYDVPGAQVIWGGHDAGYPRASRPAGLVKQIDAEFGVHPAFHNDFNCAWHHERSIHTLADALVVGLRRRVEVAGWLMERFSDWNLFMTVLSEAHSAGEVFWHGMVDRDHPLSKTPTAKLARERLLEVYREIDRATARLIEMMPSDTTVLVATVHGMEANDYDIPSMALLPELLYRAASGKKRLHGANVARWRSAGCPPILPGTDQRWNEYMKSCFGSFGRRTWSRWSRRLGINGRRGGVEELDVPIRPEIEKRPEEIAEPRSPLTWQITCWYRQHWPKMRAFALPVFYDGRVRINLRGRERDGIVEPADYDRTCDWVEQLLSECRNLRDGRPILANAQRLRAGDPMDPEGPDADLVLTWNEAIDGLEHPKYGAIGPFPFRRSGGHTSHGAAYLIGPGIEAQECGDQEALDLTSTILNLMGQSGQPSIFNTVTCASA